MAQPIACTAHHTRHGIDLFPENQRDFINEHVTYHTSGRTGNATHDDGYPERIPQSEAFSYTYHRKQRQTDAVENKKRIVQMNKVLSEKDNPQQG